MKVMLQDCFLKSGSKTTKEVDGQHKSSFPLRYIPHHFLTEDHCVSVAQSTQTVQDLAIVAQSASQVWNYFLLLLLLNSACNC